LFALAAHLNTYTDTYTQNNQFNRPFKIQFDQGKQFFFGYAAYRIGTRVLFSHLEIAAALACAEAR
jgi:hypothetical protein